MPLTRLPNGKLLYYAHVPKAAGTAVEDHLAARFGPLGMLDRSFARRSAAEAWSLSPPQHIPEGLRAALLPDTLFDATFATVRHPATRLRSVYLYAREVEKALPAKLTFGRWIEDLPRILALDPGAHHGHLRPMVDIVPHRAVVFAVEDGLGPLKAWLDDQAGQVGDAEIAPANTRAARMDKIPAAKRPKGVVLSPAHLKLIAGIYGADYARFGYETDPNAPRKEPRP